MLKYIKQTQSNNEEGFTLIELLVVILIIGVLAAIAVPTFLNNRKTAVEGALKEDVKNAGIQVEGSFKQGQGYTLSDLTSFQSTGNTLTLSVNPDTNSFCITGSNPRVIDKKWYYHNINGGLTNIDCNTP